MDIKTYFLVRGSSSYSEWTLSSASESHWKHWWQKLVSCEHSNGCDREEDTVYQYCLALTKLFALVLAWEKHFQKYKYKQK